MEQTFLGTRRREYQQSNGALKEKILLKQWKEKNIPFFCKNLLNEICYETVLLTVLDASVVNKTLWDKWLKDS